jgi:hypothetical protein
MDHFEFNIGNVFVRVHQGFRGEIPKITIITPYHEEKAILLVREKNEYGQVEIDLVEHELRPGSQPS